ncbi:unnamed protein product [Ostreobium quekettii]|uniref:Uncharacterized protein n=1 Tax=Ostreobium quekettii TaxID=121088 RepID=A0A8S1IWV3_9CHLO|nr:unnamed protein product [Ostreobium quekettii]
MSAAQRLQEVEARLAELSRSKEDLKAQIVHVVSPQPDVEETIAADSGIDPHEVAAGLAAAVDAKLHVKSLKELQEPMRELERAARTVVRSAAEGAEAYWQAVGNACSCYRTVGPLCSAVESTPAAVEHTVLQDLSQQLLSRAKVSLASIDKACREHLERRLSECGWPPPLAAPKGSVLGTEKGTSFWERLEKQGGGLLDGLLLSLAALTMVQVAVEERTGEPAGECLWFMDVMAAKLEERLRAHFASNRKTSDINQPEWLFATALKLIREHADGMAFFEGRLQTQPVDYTLAFQRRIQAAVKGLLRSSHLPALLSLGSRDLWRDWAVAAAQFDRDVAEAPFLVREVGVAYSGDVQYSCLNVFCERQEWMVAWCDAESHALVAEVEELMAAPDAWEPPKAQDWEEDEPEAASRGGTASGHELWPPRCAQGVWSLVESVVQRVEGLGIEHRAHYLRNVAGPGLQEVLRKLGAIVKQAEAYKQLTAPNWAAKVCGCACAAHYFEHHLQELVYNSSLLEVGGAQAVFGKEMSTLVGLRREQCMKLAKAVAMEFGHTSSSYRCWSLADLSLLGLASRRSVFLQQR